MTTIWQPTLTLPVSDDRDHVQGAPTAAVTLLEYGDYQCPYCGEAYPIVKELQAAMGDALRFAFRNFPISTSHPYAELAAEAAEAAAAQGKFWPMHDLLYENQQRLESDDLLGYAARVDLDVDRFRRDLADNLFAGRVHEDFMSGVRSGVNGTPTFYVDGVRYDGPGDFETMLDVLRRAAA